MRIGMDVTPLLGTRTGIGRYVGSLLAALLEDPPSPDGADRVHGVAFTVRARAGLSAAVPAGTTLGRLPLPARPLQALWSRSEALPVSLLTRRVDVFHGTNFLLPPTGRTPGVVTVHDLSFLRTPQTVSTASRAYRALVPRSVHRAAVVCTPSRAVAEEVVAAYGLSSDKVVVTPLGVDPAWGLAPPPTSELRERLGLPPEYVVFSGSLEPRKNLPLLVEAQRRLLAEDPASPPLVLIGPQGWGPRLDLSGLPEGSVVLTGYLADDELRSTVAGARVLAYPSAYEGFGLPPLEALACGVPVVAADLPVVREVVGEDPATATLTPPGDVDALADALRSRLGAVDAPDVARRRRDRAAEFTWARTAETTRAAYVRALDLMGR